MDNTLLISLSRQTALRRELDIVANNIANLNTTGFKSDGAIFSEYMSDSQPDQITSPNRRMSFVQDRMSWHDMSQGTFKQTGNPLDIAIDGDGMLVVDTPRGERYTRAGSLQINADGELVTASGDRVLGDGGPIIFQRNDRDIIITKQGRIRVREGQSLNSDTTRGTLRLVWFANTQQLQKDGASTFRLPEGARAEDTTSAKIIQGSIELSNVRSVIEMTRMIELTRAYSEVANLMNQQNDMRRNSIQQLADVPV
ncbi:MAG: flagellar basal-body rod protein FlgF [Alphaproteobacteria bacterium]|nr:flagellar basal-body rod protein FlgF [Alphaproteobacteria bacterium]